MTFTRPIVLFWIALILLLISLAAKLWFMPWLPWWVVVVFPIVGTVALVTALFVFAMAAWMASGSH